MPRAFDHQEEEQLDEIKAWWVRYGNAVMVVVTAVLVAFAAYNGWRWYQGSQAGKAAGAYEALLTAASAKDTRRVSEISGELIQDYSSTVYASFGALLAARVQYDAGDLKNARAKLQWVIDHGKDPELAALARLRLANVLIDEKDNEGALKLLDAEMPGALAALAADLKGDIYVLLNRKNDARTAYKLALDRSGSDAALRGRVQRKLEDLGTA